MFVRFGIDVGGTFTDIVVQQEGKESYFRKVPSTPQDQSVGVIDGIQLALNELGISAQDVTEIVHGTTVATNTLLERNGAKTALITTKGFRDVLEVGRQDRPGLYDIFAHKEKPLVPRALRFEVDERSLFTGEVIKSVERIEVESIVQYLVAEDIESVAVCLLHSYANARNERHIAEILQDILPQMPVSISSDILPEFREYERFNTTVLNAYVQPAMRKYIGRLSERIRNLGTKAPLLIMQSSGGMMTAEAAGSKSVQTLLSGPAGGVLAAQYLSELTQEPNFITADLGGTSFDVAIVEGQKVTTVTDGRIEGYAVKFPHIDIQTIGAGGGSIAWIDAGGALRVGPRSAGASPGPACYSKGGTLPTVTDANAVLGRLSSALSGGDLNLDIEAAQLAIEEHIARPLGMKVEEAAEGILRVVNSNMVRAIRIMTIEKGIDHRNFAILPFGGAGALHGADLGAALGIEKVIVPKSPGNFSAVGLLAAPLRYDQVQNYQKKDRDLDLENLNSAYKGLEDEILEQFEKDGFEDLEATIERTMDMRYLGQAFELAVPVPSDAIKDGDVSQIYAEFHALHERYYGFKKLQETVEIVSLRSSLLAQFGEKDTEPTAGTTSAVQVQPHGVKQAYFDGAWRETSVFDRHKLVAGAQIDGPAIVEESGSTIVLGPNDKAEIDIFENLRIYVRNNR